MNARVLLLLGSLAGNALLLTLLLGGASSSAPSASPRPGASSASARADAPPPRVWADLQTTDLPAQLSRMQAEGFPPRVIRAILAAQIHARFAARRKALAAEDANAPFWLPFGATTPEKQAELRAIAREERRLLAELVGPDSANGAAASLRRMLPGVTGEKIAQLAEIRQRYDEQRNELYAAFRGIVVQSEDMARIDELDKAARAEFAAVLTPQELEDYELRSSRAAQQLRYTLAAFDVTEAEFRALFRLQSDFEAQFSQYYRSNAPPEETRARAAAQRRLADDTKAAFGPARYAEYQRATDYAYRQTSQLVARLNLPPETIGDLRALEDEFQQKTAAVARTPATPAERLAQRAALAAEAQAKVAAKLGPSGAEAYQQYGGSWLQRLIPPPAK